MYLAEARKPRNARHPLWDKDFALEQIRSSGIGVTKICRSYAPSPAKWKALYFDVLRWRKEDPIFDQAVEDNRQRTDSKKRKNPSGGPPSKADKESNGDWKTLFCEELLLTKSRNKAALVTPYSPEEIYMMLNEKYSTYDPKFSELVHLTEMRLVAWAEETMYTSLELAQSPKDKAWIAKEILKVRDRQRWGDKLDISMTGTIQHKLPEQRARLLNEAASEMNRLLGTGSKVLLPADLTTGVPLDLVSVKPVVKDEDKDDDTLEAEIIDE